MNVKDVVRFFCELGSHKHFQRTGWLYIGESEGDTIAAHSWRAALIAYVLAKMVGANPEKAAMIALVHDIPETRTGDINKVWNRYVKKDEASAFEDILTGLNLDEFKELLNAYNSAKDENASMEAKVAKDADLLEVLLQGLFYAKKGNKQAMEWVHAAKGALLLKESREIAEAAISSAEPWWLRVKKYDS